jgi:hypothetical protein
MTSPGSTVLAVLTRCLDADLGESVVAPTLADLQFEVQSTPNAWRRFLAFARGYLAIGRVLLWHGLIWSSPMRTMLTVMLLGVLGAALLVEMFSVTTSGPAQISPFFLMTVLTPIVMRSVRGVNTRRQMFVSCMTAGSVMSVVFLVWFAIVKHPSRAPWYGYVPGLVFLLGCVALASAMIAVVTANPDVTDKRNVRGRMRNVVASSAIFGICYSVVGFLRHPASGDVLSTVSWGVFLAFFFVLVSVAIYLPILGSARLVFHQWSRAPFAIMGAFLFPIPLLAFPLLQGRFEAVGQRLLHDPVALTPTAFPHVIAGAVLGWLIAAPRHNTQHPV